MADKKSEPRPALRYAAKHGEYLDGVPARDLTEDEIDSLGLDADALVASGVYEKGGR